MTKAFTERLDELINIMLGQTSGVFMAENPDMIMPTGEVVEIAQKYKSQILALVADEIIGEDLPVNQPFDDGFDAVERTAWRIFRKGANWIKATQRKKLGI